MGINIDVNKAVKIFDKTKTVKEIVKSVLAAAKHKEFEILGYHCLPPIGASDKNGASFLTFKDYTEEDDRHYRQKGHYRHNPFMTLPLSSGVALLWSDIINAKCLTRRNKIFIEVLSKRLSGEGLSVPVYGPKGQNGVVFFQFKGEGGVPNRDVIEKFQIACQQGHLKVCQALNSSATENKKLTSRETEVLQALIKGLSNAEIANQLGISIHTVNGYLRQLFLKLGTEDRVSTAIRGLSLGVIS